MKVSLITLAGAAVMASAIAASGSEPVAPKVLATGRFPSKQLGKRTGHIRNGEGAAATLNPMEIEKWTDPAVQKEATARLAQLLKVHTIDWTKQMVLLIEAGQYRTGGYSVELTGLEVQDQTLVAKWKLHEPKPGSVVTQAQTYPAIVVLVDRFEGEVTFDPPVK